ncbi:VOC family protein [Streptomyces gobiensis]|uniref:VOC family protein n=1 Tax=Streptomyces gobiensis TaxID=2875706 RepID=UPI001E63192B|nr:VOC family protein [Streptomyces gobiensis]UGY91970.1 VOC family protein [Streptomyces gobiensis]
MSVELNHTIVYARDKKMSAEFLASILGLEVGAPFGPFIPVVTSNGVTLDFYEGGEGPITPQHYAFLVSEDDFDAIFDRIEAAGLTYYADPSHTRPGEINRMDGGRGAYFDDPDGHNMEIITRPYGSGSSDSSGS